MGTEVESSRGTCKCFRREIKSLFTDCPLKLTVFECASISSEWKNKTKCDNQGYCDSNSSETLNSETLELNSNQIED